MTSFKVSVLKRLKIWRERRCWLRFRPILWAVRNSESSIFEIKSFLLSVYSTWRVNGNERWTLEKDLPRCSYIFTSSRVFRTIQLLRLQPLRRLHRPYMTHSMVSPLSTCLSTCVLRLSPGKYMNRLSTPLIRVSSFLFCVCVVRPFSFY